VRLTIASTLILMLLTACGGDTGDGKCTEGKRQCDGTTSLKECVGGAWQAPSPCSAVCDARGLVDDGGCVADGTGSGDCRCKAAVCTLGETRCEGLDLKTCTASGWEATSCETICKAGGYVKATGCARDPVKGVDACSCEAPPSSGWGESCSATAPCPNLFTCVSYAGKSYCTQNCATLGAKCTGVPVGSYGACLVKMADSSLACAFLCKTKTGTFTCPGALSCSTTENPAGSGQYPCLP
jgi:hypothetical protein